MKKKDYVKPNAQVLSLYTDEFMEGGFHTGSNIHGSLGSVLKPSCKPTLLSTQFHKPI